MGLHHQGLCSQTPQAGFDAIQVVIDRLTKLAHFLPYKTTTSMDALAELFVKEIVRLYGVPALIISNRDMRFTSYFWRSLQQAMGTAPSFSTAYNPQSDGQLERTIQTMEDMLRACVLDFSGSWDKRLPPIEFAYNNSFHSSIQMAPFEALYDRSCRLANIILFFFHILFIKVTPYVSQTSTMNINFYIKRSNHTKDHLTIVTPTFQCIDLQKVSSAA